MRFTKCLFICFFLAGCGEHIAIGKWRVTDSDEAAVAIFSNGSARVYRYPCLWSENTDYEIVLTCEYDKGKHSMLEIQVLKNNRNMATYGGSNEVTLLRLD